MTQFLVRGRATGKTHFLIERFCEQWPNGGIITHSTQSADSIALRALAALQSRGVPDVNEMNVRYHIMSITEQPLRKLAGRGRDIDLLVDDVELVIGAMLNRSPTIITGTGLNL